jgi:hypothetical protein
MAMQLALVKSTFWEERNGLARAYEIVIASGDNVVLEVSRPSHDLSEGLEDEHVGREKETWNLSLGLFGERVDPAHQFKVNLD